MKKLSLILAAVLATVMLCSFATAETATQADRVYGFAVEDGVLGENNTVTAKIAVGDGDIRSYTTEPLSDIDAQILMQGVGADARARFGIVNYPVETGAFVEAVLNADGSCKTLNVVEKTGIFFDLAKYGGELAPMNGVAGNMVAKGWILAKVDVNGYKTITLGDGNDTTGVFRETYDVADNCKVFLADNAVNYALTVGNFDDINVTDNIEGHIYASQERWTGICVFDGNYTTYGNGAKVVAIYAMSTPDTIDEKFCFQPDDMPAISYYEATDADNALPHLPENAPWLTSTEPFEILHDRLWYVGDNEVAVYLIKAADGTLSMVDSGWPGSGYQYWSNIEKCGFDPRQIKNILLTHGHGDHYATAWDVDKIIKCSGGDPVVYNTELDCGLGGKNLGFPELAPILQDAATINCVDQYYKYGEWLNIGEGVDVYMDAAHGHTLGSATFVFKIKVADDDPQFAPGTVVGFEYMGGFGAAATLNKGFNRLAFVYGLRYIQQYIVPMMEQSCDYIYVIPQHTNHYPLLEMYKASKIAGVPLMACMVEGREEIFNQVERRIDCTQYENFWQMYLEGKDYTGGTCEVSSKNTQSIEAYGPFKRPAGEYTIELVDGGQLVHGYNTFEGACTAFEGQHTMKGQDVSKGFIIDKDSYVHDPDGWYVQLAVRVDDDYDGAVRYENNFYKEYASQWTSGPVESIHGEGWFEITRTLRLNSKEEAESLLATLEKGKKYKVQFNMASDIELNSEDLLKTFIPAE